jgi:HAD superfamily hydrolase (TIGR01484 family)
MKKVLIFDLDGTLAESKQPLDAEMASLLTKLIDTDHIVAVMSGGSFAQYKEQFLSQLHLSVDQYAKLFLLPTSGAAMYRYHHTDWREVYTRTLPLDETEHIIQTLHNAVLATGNIPEKTYGEMIEDRGSQISYSALGQHAPLEEKSVWDPNQAKRREIALYFSKLLPEYTVHIGGMTSIDITEKGVDKTYGIQQLSDILSIPIADMVFVGDALYPGGNDEPAKASGIECISVSNVAETKAYIQTVIASK